MQNKLVYRKNKNLRLNLPEVGRFNAAWADGRTEGARNGNEINYKNCFPLRQKLPILDIKSGEDLLFLFSRFKNDWLLRAETTLLSDTQFSMKGLHVCEAEDLGFHGKHVFFQHITSGRSIHQHTIWNEYQYHKHAFVRQVWHSRI